MSSRMRVTKGHSGNRRSHHALKEVRLSVCQNCGAKHERHKICLECGFYRGKEILMKKENLVKTTKETSKDAGIEKKAEEEKNTDKKEK